MRPRGTLAAALVAVALLSGCASFADSLDETANVAAAAATTEATAGTTTAGSSTTSASAAASASGSAAATTSAAEVTTAPAATTAAPPGPSAPPAPPAPPAGGLPPETTLTAYREVWGVYLSVARDYSDAEAAQMEQVYRNLRGLGYRGYYGTLCDAGAEEAGVGESDDAVVVYFSTKGQADQFIDGWNRPVVGYARVATFCTE